MVLQRALNTVRKEPAQLVTALRIIEREERADLYALQVGVGWCGGEVWCGVVKCCCVVWCGGGWWCCVA